MPKRSNDSATVQTGTSSLRNLDYEPSQQGSVDDAESANDRSEGASALSSVVSSVKRDLKVRASQGGISTTTSHSTATTRQSKNRMMWQDSDSEDDLYTSSEEEEKKSDDPATTRGSKPAKQRNDDKKKKKKVDRDAGSLESTEEPTSESEFSHGALLAQRKKQIQGKESKTPREQKESSSGRHRSSKDKSKDKSKSSKRSSSLKKKKKKKSKRKELPEKRLRFSPDAVAEAAHSRIHEDRHELRPTQEEQLPWDEEEGPGYVDFDEALEADMAARLEHVHYASGVEIASNNHDVSTLHPLGKEECQEVFKSRVPFEVPMPEDGYSSDDMSSLHALSTKVPITKYALFDEEGQQQQPQEEQQQEEVDVEQGVVSSGGAVHDTKTEELLPTTAKKKGADTLSSPRPQRFAFMERGNGELLLSTIAGVSLATLVVLLVMLFAK